MVSSPVAFWKHKWPLRKPRPHMTQGTYYSQQVSPFSVAKTGAAACLACHRKQPILVKIQDFYARQTEEAARQIASSLRRHPT